jgi:FtsP/CotA-like multicopper oxidase with cupredoxin domain
LSFALGFPAALLLVLVAATVRQVPAPRELADFEDYRQAAGTFTDGVMRVDLEARAATWQPWGNTGPTLDVHAFAVVGAGARVPGPLLRVRAGMPLEVTIRNTLPDTLIVRGLRDRLTAPAFAGDSLEVAPGATGTVRFTPTVAGSFTWYAETFPPGLSGTRQTGPGGVARDRGLAGVLIVDGVDEVVDQRERIFLLTAWADRDIPSSWNPTARFMINGRSWPHTERLVLAQDDTVHWRVINHSFAFHPMHLHGFYFDVNTYTNQLGVSGFPAGVTSRTAVTFPLPPGTAVRMSWVPHEPGNWLFHCHFMDHMSWLQGPPASGEAGPAHVHAGASGEELLGGLVMGLTVTPRPGWAPPTDTPRRALRLHIGQRDSVFGAEPGHGFVLQEGPVPPAPDSVRFPGSSILLTRGEPTQITVFNHADVPLGVHWHGLELESWSDGVPGWSGRQGRVVPAIAPGDSLTVRMTPPRSGTFMYHVHSEPGHQLSTGLYGSFLVLEPGESWNPDTDRLLLLGSLGTGDRPAPAVNGEVAPGPMEFTAGRTYRIRVMHISPNDNKALLFLDGETPVTWTVIADDGADLAADKRRTVPADIRFIIVGQTFDVLWTPQAPGNLVLQITTTPDGRLRGLGLEPGPPHVMDIPVRVR